MQWLRRLPQLFLLLVLFMGVGCGGGGGGRGAVVNPPTSERAAFRLGIAWPERTRAVQGIGSANSATIEAQRGQEISRITVNRPAGLGAKSEEYVATTAMPTGNTTFRIRLYSGPNGQGRVMGRADVIAYLNADGTLTRTEGGPLSDIQLATTVQSVVVASDQTFTLGESRELVATALDAAGSVVAVDPGAYSFQVTRGNEFLTVTPAGVATAQTPGTATVVATVDGVRSAPEPVRVDPPPSAAFHIDVVWPARTRAVQGVNSALSVKLELVQGERITTVTSDRPAGTGAQTQPVTAPQATTLGEGTLRVRFFSEVGGGGTLVGTADVPVALAGNGDLTQPDGQALPDIVVDATIKSVTMYPTQIDVNTSGQLVATAHDAGGAIVPVTPGSFTFRLVTGFDKLSVAPDGQIRGLAAGNASVNVSVDGAMSATVAVEVVAPVPPVSVEAIGVTRLVAVPSNGRLYGAGIDGGPQAGSVVRVDPVTRTVVESVAVGGTPGPIAVSDDGQYLYVALNQTHRVRRVRLQPAMALDIEFEFEPGDTSLTAEDIAVRPGHPETIALCRSDFQFSPRGRGIAIYDNGVRRAVLASDGAGGNRFEWEENGDFGIALNTEISSFDFGRVQLQADGLHAVESVSGLISQYNQDFSLSQGRIYLTDGQILKTQPFQPLGSFPDRKMMFFVRPVENTGYVMAVTWDNDNRLFRIYDRNSFAVVREVALPGPMGDVTGMVQIGVNRFAFSTTGGAVVFVTVDPLT
jgi:hypothetical protein